MLTSKQADAFMMDHLNISVGCYHDSYSQKDGKAVICWQVITEYQKYGYSNSREEAITSYWQKYHKEWTPPDIHDVEDAEPRSAEWALEYAKKKHLTFRFYKTGGCGVYPVGCPDNIVHHVGGNIVEAAHQWKSIYDPDKPTKGADEGSAREQTAVELLKEARGHILSPTLEGDYFVDKQLDPFLKEADHVD